MDSSQITLILALLAGFYLSFTIGANDVANSLGTSVGSKAVTIVQAFFIAAICEFLGAFLIGDKVTNTISKGFVHQEVFLQNPSFYAYGITAAILASALWINFASIKGWPVSTTQSIIGAVLGFAVVQGGFSSINYLALLKVFGAWIFSPILGGIFAYLSLKAILKFIIDSKSPLARAKKLIPWMVFLTTTILSSAFANNLLIRIFGSSPKTGGLILSISLGLLLFVIFRIYIKNKIIKKIKKTCEASEAENIFKKVQWVTACFLAFAHGSNDVANAIAPANAVIQSMNGALLKNSDHVPTWLLFLGAAGIVCGLVIFGKRVMVTIGSNITQITSTRGFSAEFGAALTVLFGTTLGIPLSTTHVLVGAVIGVGLARGINGINIGVIKEISKSWLITLPISALISAVFCLILFLNM